MKKFNNVLITATSIFSLLYLLIEYNNLDLSRILILILLPPVLFIVKIIREIGIKIPDWIETSYILFIIFGQLFGCAFYMMQEVKYYDKALHFLSGILTNTLGLLLLENSNLKNRTTLTDIIFILALSLAIAASWEIFEYTSDHFLNGDTQNVLTTGINDTMQDIIAATISTSIFVIIYSIIKKKTKKLRHNKSQIIVNKL